MKKFYLLFLLTSCFSLILFSIFNNKKDELVYKEYINNLGKLINDSITPHCSYKLNNSNSSLLNNIKELSINIPKSRSWSRNQINAFSG